MMFNGLVGFMIHGCVSHEVYWGRSLCCLLSCCFLFRSGFLMFLVFLLRQFKSACFLQWFRMVWLRYEM